MDSNGVWCRLDVCEESPVLEHMTSRLVVHEYKMTHISCNAAALRKGKILTFIWLCKGAHMDSFLAMTIVGAVHKTLKVDDS